MGAVELLRDLMAEGVEFEADGNRVRWRNGGTQLTPDRLAVLKDSKAEVLQFLKTNPKKETSRRRENLTTEFSDRSDTEFSRRRENPEVELFEERAAICEFDGGLTRADAEQVAAQGQGFDNVVAFRAAQEKHNKRK